MIIPISFDAELDKRVRKWWELFTSDQPIDENAIKEDVRDVIWESWKRSKEYGVRIDQPFRPPVDDNVLNTMSLRSEKLLEVAIPYMENLYTFVKGSNYLIHLADQYGCILKYYADDEMISSMMHDISSLFAGSIRNERVTGTDSVALCLAIDQPVQVVGAEHYRPENQVFFCSSAPIHDPDGGQIGAITIMGSPENYQSHTLGMACAAADGIEKALAMNQSYDLLTANRNILSSTINSLQAGILVLDSEYRITTCNQASVRILKLPERSLVTGTNLFEWIREDSLPRREEFFTKETPRRRLTLETTSQMLIEVSMGIQPIYKGEQLQNIVLVVEEQKAINRATSDISGFTATYTFNSIIGDSDAVHTMKQMGRMASNSISNVLILGESGTGKELLAQSIHNASSRATEPFVAVNCGSIPRNLIESELFGYEKGAFTGANANGMPGKFELADGGTLFLDEIGDMPFDLQVSLLRALQTRQITRIGGKYPKPVDVRLIAATNIDLFAAVQKENFRKDLYYRLNVLGIQVPPLRARKEDIPLLAERFILTYNRALGKNITVIGKEARDLLLAYSWPGNIRELENVIERAINLASGPMITPENLPEHIRFADRISYPAFGTAAETAPVAEPVYDPAAKNNAAPDGEKGLLSPEIAERRQLIAFLEKEKGHVQSVAARMDMPVSTLYRKLKKYNLNAKDYKQW